MELRVTRAFANINAETKTEVATYTVDYSVNNGELERVHARVKPNNTDGIDSYMVAYNKGVYSISSFAYDLDLIKTVMEDFKTVVEKIKSELTSTMAN